jgi:N-methylhydantoinase A
MWVVGVDVGGTFTDFVAINRADGAVQVAKVPSTPPDFERGIADALEAAEIDPSEISFFFHGTTVATNIVITKTGAKTGLIGTQGFRDLLELRRGNRAALYDLMWDPPPPLVARRNRLGVPERTDSTGAVLRELDLDEARSIVQTIKARDLDAVAVCFLNSHVNALNEERMRDLLASELPGVFLSVACDVAPEPREFERTATTVANAYVGPACGEYLQRLEDATRSLGYSGKVLVMHSGGGLLTSEAARATPVRLAHSGPAAGVAAAAAIGVAAGKPDVLSLDMGGTSADIALVLAGTPRTKAEFEIEWGLPVLFPSVDVVTIGAGGGSIAWLDRAGIPRSGPQSAGAFPGPASYGLGGTDPTNTDANLVLGRLDPERFLGGRMPIDVELAREAIAEKIAAPLGLDVAEAAAGILRISNHNMAAALRLVSVERGYDPRELTLVAFGGAGPLHAAELAREVGIPEVIVPPLPGITSAIGLLFADLVRDVARAVDVPRQNADTTSLDRQFAELEAAARERVRLEAEEAALIQAERLIDFRYQGQARTITVALAPGEITDALLGQAIEQFHREHEREFGYDRRDFEVDLAMLRVSARAETTSPDLGRFSSRVGIGRHAGATRPVYFDESGWVDTAIYDRGVLAPGTALAGPAIIEAMDSTIVLPPASRAEIDDITNVIIHV